MPGRYLANQNSYSNFYLHAKRNIKFILRWKKFPCKIVFFLSPTFVRLSYILVFSLITSYLYPFFSHFSFRFDFFFFREVADDSLRKGWIACWDYALRMKYENWVAASCDAVGKWILKTVLFECLASWIMFDHNLYDNFAIVCLLCNNDFEKIHETIFVKNFISNSSERRLVY